METINYPLSRLPNELLSSIIDFMDLFPPSHVWNDLMEVLSDNESDSEETEIARRELDMLEKECRRNLCILAKIRLLHEEATKLLYAHFGHIGIRHAAMRNDAGLAERCFAHADSIGLRLNRRQEGQPERIVEGTVLHTAVEAGSVDVVKLLLEIGCNIEAKAKVLLPKKLGASFCSRHANTKLSPLGLSLILGHRAISRILLDRGASIDVGFVRLPGGDAEDELIFDAVHAAAMSDDGEIMETLLQQHGIDPDTLDSKGFTALHWAICSPRGLGNVQILLDAGADISTSHSPRMPLLHYLRQVRGKPDEVEAVFRILFTTEAQANINQPDHWGITQLGHAANHLNVEIMRLYLQHGANPALGESDSDRPLNRCLTAHKRENAKNFDMEVAEKGLAAVKLLLDAGLREDPKVLFTDMLKANLGVAKEFLLELATHFSLSHEDLEQLFLDVGCFPFPRLNTGLSFLLENFVPTDPAVLDRWPVFGLLIKTPLIRDPSLIKLMGPNFDPNHHSQVTGTTEFAATLQNSHHAYSRCSHIVEALLRHGADINARNTRGDPCLHLYYSCHLDSYYRESSENSAGESVLESTQSFCALARKLAEYGYDFNAQDQGGDTILHLLAGNPIADLRGECVETLIALGADVTIQNNADFTPLDKHQDTRPNTAMSLSPMRGSFERAIRAALPSVSS